MGLSNEAWVERWQTGQTGWHEQDGNDLLHRFWPDQRSAGSVLVPLCGGSEDLVWLARRGWRVTGVELSTLAIEKLLRSHGLAYEVEALDQGLRYRVSSLPLTIHAGDYFEFSAAPASFDALFDRGCLVALDERTRPIYVERTKALLKDNAYRMIIALEYDQAQVEGPPFSVMAEEVKGYWPDLQQRHVRNDLIDLPDKFQEAGVTDLREVVWTS